MIAEKSVGNLTKTISLDSSWFPGTSIRFHYERKSRDNEIRSNVESTSIAFYRAQRINRGGNGGRGMGHARLRLTVKSADTSRSS